MIYIRTKSSIKLFPRICLSLYLIYHFYVYCQPQGFHLLALLIMFVLLLVAMIHCVRKYELDGFCHGLVSIDQPR